MQVALELTARGVAGLDDTRARGEQLLPRVGARESQTDELGEVAQAWKTSRGSAPEATRVATRRSAACSFAALDHAVTLRQPRRPAQPAAERRHACQAPIRTTLSSSSCSRIRRASQLPAFNALIKVVGLSAARVIVRLLLAVLP